MDLMPKLNAAQEGAPAPEERLIDVAEIGRMIRRRWLPITLAIVAVLGLTAVMYATAERLYVATGRVALDKRTDQPLQAPGGDRPVTTDSAAVDTEVQVLKSPAIAAAAVDRLKLASDPNFGARAGQGAPGSREAAVRKVMSGLDIRREGSSYAIAVSYSAKDPQTAARVVNAVLESYTSGQKSSEYSQRANDIMLLRDRLAVLRGEVISADRALSAHRASTNLIDITADGPGASATMQSLNGQLAQARADEAAASARAAAAASSTDASVNSLRAEQARLNARKAELSRRYNPSYPTVVAIDQQLSAINQALNSEIARARQAAVADAQAARNRAASLSSSVRKEQGQLMSANRASVQLGELERNAAAAKSLYQALLDEYRQKIVALGTERSKAQVIASAAPPGGPASPDPLAYAMAGLLAALLLAAIVAVVLETREAGLLSRGMVEQKLGLPVIASIPDIATVADAPLKGGGPAAIADHMLNNPHSIFAEGIRTIRTALELGQDGQKVRTLALTSALSGEGKTTTAICLARSAAAADLRVMLIDCDVRRHTASDALVPGHDLGLVEVLHDRARLEQVLVNEPATGVDILPAGGMHFSPMDPLPARALWKLLARLRQNYDLIILETAPVLPVAETRAIAAMADGTLMAVRWRETPTVAVSSAITELDRAGAKIVGALLCRVDLRSGIAASHGDNVYYYPSARPQAA
jgi:capsular exopolysaccharide synthesis family protein